MESGVLFADLLGKPAWMGLASIGIVIALLAAGVVYGPARTRAQRRVPAQAAQPLS